MSKYNARRVSLDGYWFDSVAESRRYMELKLLEAAGEISELQVHPRYELLRAEQMPDGTKLRAVHYVADFTYSDRAALRSVVEDVKGVVTPVYRLKASLFRRRYPNWDLREVSA